MSGIASACCLQACEVFHHISGALLLQRSLYMLQSVVLDPEETHQEMLQAYEVLQR